MFGTASYTREGARTFKKNLSGVFSALRVKKFVLVEESR
jgi:hypothetical protein